MHLVLFCGERGIRTPGGVTLNGFQDRRIRPLCHFSNGCKYTALFFVTKPIQPLIQHDNLIPAVFRNNRSDFTFFLGCFLLTSFIFVKHINEYPNEKINFSPCFDRTSLYLM